MTSHIYHVIKDPVHGTMQFTSIEDAWIKPFIDHPLFQRMRHIKQLGLGDFIFPGASHTRFNHSLGCCYVATQIAHKIGLSSRERQLVMIASLLHDIGHGPFSHAFEGLFYQKSIKHEDWTPYFLEDFSNKIFFSAYNKLNPKERLSANSFNEIRNMIMHKAVKNPVLADIVSSQLDADRLDYLLRDSHFCGVKYGEFDLRWMLHCMCIVNTKEGPRLGITHKGIGVVEHYLMARRLMIRNIYHLQKKLALEFFLVELLIILSKSLATDMLFAHIKENRLSVFLIAANEFNLAIKNKDKVQSKKIKNAFLHEYYHYYKDLSDYDLFHLIKMLSSAKFNHPAVTLADRLAKRIMPVIVPLQKHARIENKLNQFKRSNPDIYDWQLSLITTPHQAYSREADPIFVLNEKKMMQPLSESSFMIQAISDRFEHMHFLLIDKGIADDQRVRQFLKGESIWHYKS